MDKLHGNSQMVSLLFSDSIISVSLCILSFMPVVKEGEGQEEGARGVKWREGKLKTLHRKDPRYRSTKKLGSTK